MSSFRTLAELRKGQRARVVQVGAVNAGSQAQDTHQVALARALLEMGILEGSEIEVMHEAPLSLDPIAVSVRGGLIALRRQEAALVRVEPLA